MQTVYTAIGLMSGTSLDGVDAAFLETDGERIVKFGPSLTHAYSSADRDTLTQATRAALRWQFQGSAPNSFAAAEDIVANVHKEAISKLAAAYPDWMARLDIIGFHGQTVLHHPPTKAGNGQTLQLGDGQALAEAFGVPVVYDFRSADVAAGGQGAPLAPIYHKALATYSGLGASAAILNIGGVSNVTLAAGDKLLATDCGPGNGPLDNWMADRAGLDFDAGGAVCVKGTPDFAMIEKWLSRDFFQRPLPRSADRYDFDVASDLAGQSLEDGAAALAGFCAAANASTIKSMGLIPDSLVVCGGGRYNKAILWGLAEQIPATVLTAEDVGWDGDAIEAQAFAYLAVRSKLGLPISYPGTTGAPAPMTGGQIAYPSAMRG